MATATLFIDSYSTFCYVYNKDDVYNLFNKELAVFQYSTRLVKNNKKLQVTKFNDFEISNQACVQFCGFLIPGFLDQKSNADVTCKLSNSHCDVIKTKDGIALRVGNLQYDMIYLLKTFIILVIRDVAWQSGLRMTKINLVMPDLYFQSNPSVILDAINKEFHCQCSMYNLLPFSFCQIRHCIEKNTFSLYINCSDNYLFFSIIEYKSHAVILTQCIRICELSRVTLSLLLLRYFSPLFQMVGDNSSKWFSYFYNYVFDNFMNCSIPIVLRSSDQTYHFQIPSKSILDILSLHQDYGLYCIQKILDQQGLEKNAINHIILCGKNCRNPYYLFLLRQIFPITPISTVDFHSVIQSTSILRPSQASFQCKHYQQPFSMNTFLQNNQRSIDYSIVQTLRKKLEKWLSSSGSSPAVNNPPASVSASSNNQSKENSVPMSSTSNPASIPSTIQSKENSVPIPSANNPSASIPSATNNPSSVSMPSTIQPKGNSVPLSSTNNPVSMPSTIQPKENSVPIPSTTNNPSSIPSTIQPKGNPVPLSLTSNPASIPSISNPSSLSIPSTIQSKGNPSALSIPIDFTYKTNPSSSNSTNPSSLSIPSTIQSKGNPSALSIPIDFTYKTKPSSNSNSTIHNNPASLSIPSTIQSKENPASLSIPSTIQSKESPSSLSIPSTIQPKENPIPMSSISKENPTSLSIPSTSQQSTKTHSLSIPPYSTPTNPASLSIPSTIQPPTKPPVSNPTPPSNPASLSMPSTIQSKTIPLLPTAPTTSNSSCTLSIPLYLKAIRRANLAQMAQNQMASPVSKRQQPSENEHEQSKRAKKCEDGYIHMNDHSVKSISYEGNCINNQLEGVVIHNFPMNFKRIGNYRNEQLDGKAYFLRGEYQIGNGEYINGKLTGKGFVVEDPNTIIQGTFKDGKKEGVCTVFKDNCIMFSGYFVNDMKEGLGKEYNIHGVVYEGNYKNGKRHGHGRLVLENGNVYEGNFVNDIVEGEGELKDKYGHVIHKGLFRNNKFSNGKKIDDNLFVLFCVCCREFEKKQSIDHIIKLLR